MSKAVVTVDAAAPGYGRRLLDAICTSGATTVLFDYFDTMVTRTIHPEDVKRIASERVARIVGGGISGQALYGRRSAIERQLCDESVARGWGPEFSLRELADRLWESERQRITIPREAFADLLLEVELAVELRVQRVDEELLSVVRTLVDAGIRCCLVSDFYLPSKDFRRMLDRHGIDGLFEQVYVSADTLRTKRSGLMYSDILLSAPSTAASSMVMIGDNALADVENALAHGLHAIHLNREAQHKHYAAATDATNDVEDAERRIEEALRTDTGEFGALALTYYFFIDTLHHRLVKGGVRDVFFLAREGQFLKRLFDAYQERHRPAGTDCIRSHYLEVSRRSTFLPSLRTLKEENFETLFRQYRKLSAIEFLESLGLANVSQELERETGADLAVRWDDFPSTPLFERITKTSSVFREAYEQERHSRREAFLAYLYSFDCKSSAPDLHLVDVGWKGTIQDNLRNLLDNVGPPHSQLRLHGHYLGLIAPGAARRGNEKTGLVFSSVGQRTRNCDVFNENRALFEVSLGADHGSAVSYQRDASGRGHVCRGEFVEQALYLGKVVPLQERLFRLFSLIDDILIDRVFPYDRLRTLTTRHHARMVFEPTPNEIEWFENVFHVENFGVFELSRFSEASRTIGFLSALRFYLQLRRNASAMDLGFWPLLACLRRGGPFVARRYSLSKLRKIEP